MADEITIEVVEGASPSGGKSSGGGGGDANALVKELVDALKKAVDELSSKKKKEPKEPPPPPTPEELQQQKRGDIFSAGGIIARSMGHNMLARGMDTLNMFNKLGVMGGTPGAAGTMRGLAASTSGAAGAAGAAGGAAAGAAGYSAAAGSAAAAGGLSMTAMAGPIGMIVAMVMEVKEKVKQTIIGGIRAVGEFAGRSARMDTGAFGDGLEKAAKAIPFFGDFLEEAVKGLRNFVNGLDETAARLSPYSGALATSSAMAGVKEMLGDMRRADAIGETLAKFVDVRSELKEKGEDLLFEIMKPFIPLATVMLEALEPFLDGSMELIKATEEFFAMMAEALNKWGLVSDQSLAYLKGIAARMPKKDNEHDLLELQELLSTGVSLGAMADRDQRVSDRREAALDRRSKLAGL